MWWSQGVGRCFCFVEVVNCLTEDELDFLMVRIHHNGTGQTEQVAKRHLRERGEAEEKTYIQ
jgi:hypothetical protein